MVELVLRVAMGAILALVVGWPVRRMLARWSQREFYLPWDAGTPYAPEFTPLHHTQFVRSNDQGNFGELLTSMMMTSQGWWAIPGKVNGPQGIDGIFIRAERRGWQARMIETKTNSSRYLPRQMSDEKLLKDLDRLYLTAPARLGPVYAGLHKAVRQGSRSLSKELWRHSLQAGQTQAQRLDRDGQAGADAGDPSNPAMMRALFEGLREFDHTGASIQDPDS